MAPTNNTMYAYQVQLLRTEVIGHVTMNVSTGGTSDTFYSCFYNAAGTTLLWSANGTVNSALVNSFSAAQYTAVPGVYLAAFEESGTTSATLTAFPVNGTLANIINQNGKRWSTAANLVSGGVCPATLGTLTAISSTLPAIAFEP